MKDVSDVLTVSFDSGLNDESALCVSQKYGEKIIVLKMELGEQADILYHLLTEQMTKAEIKAETKSERKVGEWVPQDFNKRNGNTSTCVYYFPKCSVCGHVGDERFAFCPNCGADMRGEQDE